MNKTNTDIETKLGQFHCYLLHTIGELEIMQADARNRVNRGKEAECFVAQRELVDAERAFRRHFPKIISKEPTCTTKT